MSNVFWKHFHLCFSTLKCLPSMAAAAPSHPFPSSSTPERDRQDNGGNSNPSSLVVMKNFNSLYDISSEFSDSTESDSNPSPPDFTAIFASQRFFFSSPGLSSSITDSSSASPSTSTTCSSSSSSNGSTKLLLKETPLRGGGVAVKKYSPDPYKDFRCSMQEMIEARNLITEDRHNLNVMANWDFLHELLLCYLTLNPKHTHKFIITAFADILITLLSASSPDSVDDFPRRNLQAHRR